MPERLPLSTRLSFARKVAVAAALVALADVLFYAEEPGWTLGLFALAWAVGLAACVPAVRRRGSLAALTLAAGFALVMIDDPNPLAWVLFWTAIASAALLPRHRFDNAIDWGMRLLVYGLRGLVRPIVDAGRVLRGGLSGRIGGVAALLALPVVGGLVFATLFAAANPVIGAALDRVEIPSFGRAIGHAIFWMVVLVVVWPSLRPRAIRLADQARPAFAGVTLPVATLALSLVTFNALFAVQNALDLVFLWSGAPLPAGVTLADYAHRGAYTLILTALLAGSFVLVAFAPGGAAARSVAVRRLVIVWVVQNVLLVASSMLRLLDYVEAYSLTEWRIAALAWMALVAVGLVLIVVRLLAGRSAAWLVNANAAAAALVLAAASAIDLGAVAATWNVAHARHGEDLDLCYLTGLGSSALLPLIDLERRAGGPELRDRVRYLRTATMTRLEEDQHDWHSWTWRGARRLAAARAQAAALPITLRPAPHGRLCNGERVPPPPPEVAPAPLTDGARP